MIIKSTTWLTWKVSYKDDSIFSLTIWTFWWESRSWITSIADLKGAADNDASLLVSKTDFTSYETKIDNLDVDKLMTVPANLS